MEGKSNRGVFPTGSKRANLFFALALAGAALLAFQYFITDCFSDGRFMFEVRVKTERAIKWMKASDLLENDLAKLDQLATIPEELVRFLPSFGYHCLDINPDKNPFPVYVVASGKERELLFWTYEYKYYRRPYFALFGQFEDGEYFAKITPTPTERHFRGSVMVELP